MEKPLRVRVTVALEKDGKFLILRRTGATTNTPEGLTRSHFAGVWEFPGGGANKGEDLRKGAERETQEEAGIAIKAMEDRGVMMREDDDKISEVHLFYSNDFEGDARTSPEHDMLKWATKEEIRRMRESGEKIGLDTLKFLGLQKA